MMTACVRRHDVVRRIKSEINGFFRRVQAKIGRITSGAKRMEIRHGGSDRAAQNERAGGERDEDFGHFKHSDLTIFP